MPHPTGLLLTATPLTSDHVSAALAEQGGPSWDRTLYRMLTGVDVRSLCKGAPVRGTGAAVSVASSGWWLRPIDQLADYVSAASGQPVLAIAEHPGVPGASYHLATPGDSPVRRVRRDRVSSWAEGVALLTGGEALGDADVQPLREVARQVHGDDPAGADLPAMACFRFLPERRGEWPHLLEQRGAALTLGLPWRSDVEASTEMPLPAAMRAIRLDTAVRLPGPPRWARAIRPEVIDTARAVVEADGWVCLLPMKDGTPLQYGAAVRILQLAPLADGSWLGVLHPRSAVRVTASGEGTVQVEAVPQRDAHPAELGASRLSLVEALSSTRQPVQWSKQEIEDSKDPAALIAHQVQLSADACQKYLAAEDAAERASILATELS